MRLNRTRLNELMQQQNLVIEDICHRTGLYKKSIQWILDNGAISEEALERIADAVGVEVKEIYLPDATAYSENVIEFAKDSKRATLSLSQERYKTRVKELAKKYPEECEIVALNKDGSMCAHIPAEWIRINPGKELTEEQKEQCAERARKNLHTKNNQRKTG